MTQMVKNLSRNAGDLGSIPGSGKIPWRREWQPIPVYSPGKSHEQRSLVDYNPWGHKQSDTIEQLSLFICLYFDSTIKLYHCMYALKFCINSIIWHGLPKRCSGIEYAYQCSRHKRWGFSPWVRKISWSRKWQPTQIFTTGIFHGQMSLVHYCPWRCKQSDMTEWLSVHACVHTHTLYGMHFVLVFTIFLRSVSGDQL